MEKENKPFQKLAKRQKIIEVLANDNYLYTLHSNLTKNFSSFSLLLIVVENGIFMN